MMDERRNWFVGVDWASETHHVCVLDGHGDKLGERGFTHGGAGLAEMADWILKMTGGEASAVHVAIEVPHGPVVESLIERGFAVHAINPKQLDRDSATASRRPAPRTTVAMPMCSATRSGPTRAACVASRPSIPS